MKWASIPGYSCYEVSENGDVKTNLEYNNRYKQHVMKKELTKFGYYRVKIKGDDGIFKRIRVHRLVYSAFVGPVPDGLELNHINGIKTDNRLVNLEAITRSENLLHARRLGLNKNKCRFTARDVSMMKNMRSSGSKFSEIAQEFNTTPRYARKIVSGQKWKYHS